MTENRSDSRQQLSKRLHPFDLFTIGFGAIIGVGWILVVGDWVQAGGGPLGTTLAFLVGMLCLYPIARVFGSLTVAMPIAGGAFIYTLHAFGRRLAFITGWLLTLAYVMMAPWEIIAIGELAQTLFSGLATIPLYQIGSQTVYLPTVILCLCVAGAMILINRTGVEKVTRIQKLLVILLSLIFCMVIGLILGMGLTVTPAYVILAALIAPVLTRLGLLPQQAHLFCFYYACLCGITPPVAIGAFAAAGIADADPMKTGLTSVRLAGSLYIIPFMFAYAPQLILIGTVPEIIQCVITSAIGVYCFSIAVEGWLFKKISIPFRLIVGVASLLCIYPGTLTDVIGLSILSVFIVFSVIKRKHDREKPLTA